ncbi:hypothetical protein DUI87_03226 [Hirundo rustica rustica]|uniref:Reverse transcriptase/retrotransposon-derived protein RNase H-like domain-containing protein n=1 Tax=Hirundo rustica rustica TaxID=333673 RepID=A0A3M0L2Y4_HIRRU|nr:hypothetical protein DUI87_03226 [Hirundo rustica rustica]
MGGYKVSREKAQIAQQTVIYLGCEISQGQRKLGTNRIQAICAIPEPQNLHELRVFLGMAGWCRLCIMDYELIAKPLYEAQKMQPFTWGKPQKEAFLTLKEALTTAPALELPDLSKDFQLFVHERLRLALRVLTQCAVGKNGSTLAGTSVLSPFLHIGSVIALAAMIYKKSAVQLFERHLCLYILTFGFVPAKITNQLVVAHMTKSEIALHLDPNGYRVNGLGQQGRRIIKSLLRQLVVEATGEQLPPDPDWVVACIFDHQGPLGLLELSQDLHEWQEKECPQCQGVIVTEVSCGVCGAQFERETPKLWREGGLCDHCYSGTLGAFYQAAQVVLRIPNPFPDDFVGVEDWRFAQCRPLRERYAGIDIALGYGMQEDQLTTLHKMKREVQAETQVIKVSNAIRAENVMIGLVKDFAKMQNTSRITACLPIPKAARDPISWGIITPKLPEIRKNKTITCKQVPESRQVVKETWTIIGYEWMRPLRKQDCILSHGKVGQIIEWWVTDHDLAKWECFLPHYKKIKENITETTLVWKCEEKDWKSQIEPWNSAWSLSILKKFQYMANTPWCIKWEGSENETDPVIMNTATSSRMKADEVRTRREVPDQDETWQEPSSGVKFGWALESLLSPVANYRNREMLYKLTGQVDRLARVTREGFKELNMQLQATTKMTVQNRLALDMLLLKEHGVCGFLKGQIDHCCIHIPNVTADEEYDISQLKQIEHEAEEEEKHLTMSWLDKIFKGLGWNGQAQEIQFLGVKWQDRRRQISTEVINKIIAMSPPTNKKETQAFPGAIGFWRMHIPEYSQIVSPLYLVTHKKNDFHWGPEQQQAFAQIKQEMAHAVALGPVRTGPEVKNVLYSAAGNNGLSWSLWQKVPGETRGRPLGFWSRSYRGSETNYTPTEKEIWATYCGGAELFY